MVENVASNPMLPGLGFSVRVGLGLAEARLHCSCKLYTTKPSTRFAGVAIAIAGQYSRMGCVTRVQPPAPTAGTHQSLPHRDTARNPATSARCSLPRGHGTRRAIHKYCELRTKAAAKTKAAIVLASGDFNAVPVPIAEDRSNRGPDSAVNSPAANGDRNQ